MHERITTTKTMIGALCVWFVVAHWTTFCCGFESALTLRFTLEPDDLVSVNQSSVILNCTANSSTNGGSVEISWQRNGKALVPDGRQYVLSPNGSLLIQSFTQQPYDSEFYECIAKSGSSALLSRRARLQVAVLGNFSGHPQSVAVREGGNARFECTISGVPKPTVTWMKNGQPLPQSERFKELPSHVLQIVNVSTSDVGNYFCQASNGFGDVRASNNARLTVHLGNRVEAIQLLSGPKDLEVEINDTAIFECFPSHGRASIVWKRKDGLPLPRDRIQISNSGNLEISQINTTDDGNYTCEVDGSSELFGEATLSVIAPPKLKNYERDNNQARAQQVSLTCEFNGVPQPVTTWLKNAKPIRIYGRIAVQGNMLKIGQSVDSDSALYQCWGENHAGRTGAVFSVTVIGSAFAPEPPTAVRAHVVDSRTIEISWRPARTNAAHAVIAYSVQYWPTLGGEEIQQVLGGEENKPVPTSKVIHTLQPHTNYTFYVRAYNHRGASEPSAYIVQATDEDVPSSGPDFNVSAWSDTSLLVSWKELPSNRARGVVTYYKIFYRKDDERPLNVTVPSDVFKYEITDLETYETYSVCVLAATKAGLPKMDENRWPWVSQSVGENSHVGVMLLSNVKMHPVNATTVYITWDTPESPGIDFLGFKVYYRLLGDEEHRVIPLVQDQKDFTLYSLEPNTVYEISIAPFGDNGEGQLYSQILRTPPIGNSSPGNPPSPPVISEVRPVNETAIHLSWLAPAEKVTYYSVACVLVNADETEERPQEKLFNCSSTQLVISGLSPFTEYHFTVRSHSPAGPGPFSSGVTCRTEATRPPGLLQLTWFLQEPTVVQLNWKMPPDADAIVSQYVVSYCEDRFAADHPWHTHIENGSLCYTVLRDLKSRTTYQVRMHAENKRGSGPPSSIKVLTGISSETEYDNNNSDRMMGIIIGIGISGGCIIICVIIILLRNRCLPPSRGPSLAMQHTNGFTTPLRSNGYVTGSTDDKHSTTNFHEPDGTTPMLNQPQESDYNVEHKTEMPSRKSKQLHVWRSADSRKANSTDKSTTVV